MSEKKRDIWVFGDYRNYFQNRVTLQLLSRARELAVKIDAEVCAVVFGHWTEEWVDDALAQNPTFCGVVQEYIAHGADKVYLTDHPRLALYSMETYALLMERLARREKPEIILIGATTFGREFAPRLAKRLETGLTADCIGLDINPEGLLVQTAPSFGGSLVAEIITPERRPQMATVRPGTFQEIPHDNARTGKVVKVPLPKDLPADRVRLIRSDRRPQREQKLEDAKVVVCGGRGLQSKKKFAKLFELAELLGGEGGATRPVVYADWAGPRHARRPGRPADPAADPLLLRDQRRHPAHRRLQRRKVRHRGEQKPERSDDEAGRRRHRCRRKPGLHDPDSGTETTDPLIKVRCGRRSPACPPG